MVLDMHIRVGHQSVLVLVDHHIWQDLMVGN